MYHGLTGQSNLDAAVAGLIILAVFALGMTLYLDRLGELASSSKYVARLSKLLRYSDFLLYTSEGLAVVNNGIVRDHVVDCSKLYSAYQYLRRRGFRGSVRCGSLVVGEECEGDSISRKAIWNGNEILIEVRICS